MVYGMEDNFSIFKTGNFLPFHIYSILKIFHSIMGVGKGGQEGPWPHLDFHTLSLTYQISKILPFLVVNTCPVLIATPEQFSADALAFHTSIAHKSFRYGATHVSHLRNVKRTPLRMVTRKIKQSPAKMRVTLQRCKFRCALLPV